jgi:hypothetical protein
MFLLLSKEMDKENKIIASQETLADLLNCTRQSVSTAAKHLIKNNMITIFKTGNSSIYCLNSELVWTDRADKKKYASFNAKVLISEKEQGTKIKKSRTKRIEIKK